MLWFKTILALPCLANLSFALPQPVDSRNSTADHHLSKRSLTLHAWRYSASCSGSADYTWTGINQGCITYNGNTDVYSWRFEGDIDGRQGNEFITASMHYEKFDCSSGAYEPWYSAHAGECIHRGGGGSIKALSLYTHW